MRQVTEAFNPGSSRSPAGTSRAGVEGHIGAGALVTVVAFAVAVRLPMALARGWVGYDEANYLMIARNAAAGLGYTQSALTTYAPKFHPLSFLVPQLMNALGIDLLHSSVLIFIAGGALSSALAGLLGGALFGGRVGLVSAALVAVAPVMTSGLVESISHSFFIPAYLGALLLVWRYVTGGTLGLVAGGGLCAGLAWWARADGALMVPFVAAYLLVAGTALRGWRRGVSGLGAFVCGFGVFFAAYVLFARAITPGGTAVHGPLFDFLALPIDCHPSRDLRSYPSLLVLALHEPGCILARVAHNAKIAPAMLLSWTGFPLAFLVLVGAGLVAEPKLDRRGLAAHTLLLAGVCPIVSYVPFHFEETRYVAPYAAVGFVWVALGLIAVGDRLRPILGAVGAWGPTAAVVLLLLGVSVLHARRLGEIGGVELVEAGRWLDRTASKEAVVWTSQSEVAYFARRPWTYPPAPDDAESWRRLGGAEVWLVVDGRFFLQKNASWTPVLRAGAPDELEQVFETAAEPKVRIFRVRRGPFPASGRGE